MCAILKSTLVQRFWQVLMFVQLSRAKMWIPRLISFHEHAHTKYLLVLNGRPKEKRTFFV